MWQDSEGGGEWKAPALSPVSRFSLLPNFSLPSSNNAANLLDREPASSTGFFKADWARILMESREWDDCKRTRSASGRLGSEREARAVGDGKEKYSFPSHVPLRPRFPR